MSELKIDAPVGQPLLHIERELDASAELVFRCMTEPDLIEQWWGPRKYRTKVEHIEPRHGGTWRFLNIDDDGNEYGFHGVFHNDPSVDAGVIQTWEFEAMPGAFSMETMTFERNGDKTIVRGTSMYPSVEHRDGHVASGMEYGMRESFERMQELAKSLSSSAL